MSIVSVKSWQQPSAEHKAEWGGYNDAPPGFVEISEGEFAQSHWFTYSPEFIENRQFVWPDAEGRKVFTSVRLYYMHDHCGYGVAQDYWGKRVRYFKFGCKHEWGDARPELQRRGIRLGRCETARFCVKCGHFEVIDSSD